MVLPRTFSEEGHVGVFKRNKKYNHKISIPKNVLKPINAIK
jgi:hypothetical protein